MHIGLTVTYTCIYYFIGKGIIAIVSNGETVFCIIIELSRDN